MVNFLTLFCVLFCTFSYAQNDPQLVKIPMEVYVPHGKNNFSTILYKDSTLKDKVAFLHAHNELDHDLSVITNSFSEYWKQFKGDWFWIKFHKNQPPLLLFRGLKVANDEREYIQLYDVSRPQNKRRIFTSVGNLLAYKIQPNTAGLILYVHEYPCCHSATHFIKVLRYIDDKIRIKKRFFVGRSKGDMKGPFYPKESKIVPGYKILQKKTAVRWSPEIIEKGAFMNWSPSNLLIHYKKGAVYKVLGEDNGWLFIFITSGITHESSRMLNYTTFKHTGIYGWIKE